MGEGLGDLRHTYVAEEFGEEAGVDQVEDGVFDAADVEVHRHPETALAGIDDLFVVPRGGVAEEVPGGVEEGVHGVRLPVGGMAADGTADVSEALGLLEGVADEPLEVDVRGKEDRKVLFRNGNEAAMGAVDHGDRRSPIPLP